MKANILAATKELDKDSFGEVYNVGSGVNHSVNQIADMISKKQKHIPPRSGEARITLAHISKIKDKLGWEPTIQVEDWIRANIPPISQTRLDKWRRLWIGI